MTTPWEPAGKYIRATTPAHHIIEGLSYVDALAMSIRYPETFEFDGVQHLIDTLQQGDFVKVCLNDSERIWTQIESVTPEGVIEAALANDPLCFTQLFTDDLLRFHVKNVYEVMGAAQAFDLMGAVPKV